MNNKIGIFSSAVLATVATASTALAHTSSEIGVGFIHPISGIDHLLALLANALVGVLKSVLVAAVAVLALCKVTSPNVPTSKVAGDEEWDGLAEVRKKAAVSGGTEMAVRNPVGDV